MKKVWSNDPGIIEEKLNTLLQHRIPVTLAKKGHESQTVFLREINQKKTVSLIQFTKSKDLCYKQEPCFFLYRPLEYITHIFEGAPLDEDEKRLTILKPSVIFELSKRKFPRIPARTGSLGVYLLPYSTRLYKASLKNVSREGLLMVGTCPSFIKEGITIGPLDLTLERESSVIDPLRVHIPEAVVVRVNRTGENGLAEMAVHFQLEGENLYSIDQYIEWQTRKVEVSAA